MEDVSGYFKFNGKAYYYLGRSAWYIDVYEYIVNSDQTTFKHLFFLRDSSNRIHDIQARITEF